MSAYDTLDAVALDAQRSAGHVAFVLDCDGVEREIVLGLDGDYYWTTVSCAFDVNGNRMGFRQAPYAVFNTFSPRRPEQVALRI
jgi:hypothetical protein